jgi:hypothetical protein
MEVRTKTEIQLTLSEEDAEKLINAIASIDILDGIKEPILDKLWRELYNALNRN